MLPVQLLHAELEPVNPGAAESVCLPCLDPPLQSSPLCQILLSDVVLPFAEGDSPAASTMPSQPEAALKPARSVSRPPPSMPRRAPSFQGSVLDNVLVDSTKEITSVKRTSQVGAFRWLGASAASVDM